MMTKIQTLWSLYFTTGTFINIVHRYDKVEDTLKHQEPFIQVLKGRSPFTVYSVKNNLQLYFDLTH